MQGKIKKVLSNRGYGFIEREGSDEDLFFHKSNLEGTDIFTIKEETAVEFEISDGRRGPEAINIKVLTGSDAGSDEAAEEPASGSDEAAEEPASGSDEAAEEPASESDEE